MKKNLFILFCILINTYFFALEGTENQIKFIKGNLIDKTTAVRQSSGKEGEILSLKAIDFCLENKDLLKDDRELAALAVAGVLSLPNSSFNNTNDSDLLYNKFFELFNSFSDDTVKIAVLNKLSSVDISNEKFTSMLNNFISSENILNYDSNLLKSVITTLGSIGNNESFNVLYNLLNKNKESNYKKEIETSLALLSEKSATEVLNIIKSGNIEKSRIIFDLIQNNKNNSQVFKAEIAENVLVSTIYICETTSDADGECVSLLLDALRVLANFKWTRGAKTAVASFDCSVKLFESEKMSQVDFIEVVNGVSIIAPFEAVSVLSNYLVKMNKLKESGDNSKSVEDVVYSLILALGAIGDKNSFDSLLAVTYYNYSDYVITAARNALSRLKW